MRSGLSTSPAASCAAWRGVRQHGGKTVWQWQKGPAAADSACAAREKAIHDAGSAAGNRGERSRSRDRAHLQWRIQRNRLLGRGIHIIGRRRRTRVGPAAREEIGVELRAGQHGANAVTARLMVGSRDSRGIVQRAHLGGRGIDATTWQARASGKPWPRESRYVCAAASDGLLAAAREQRLPERYYCSRRAKRYNVWSKQRLGSR